MKTDLSYLMITPYTIAKSRIGGVLSRLLSQIDLELVGAQMIAPTMKFAKEYAEIVWETSKERNPRAAKILREYIERNLCPSGGRKHRVLVLLFKGDQANEKLAQVAGSLYQGEYSVWDYTGETIRDTYGDFVLDPFDREKIAYFEPAILTPKYRDTSTAILKLLGEFMKGENTIVENVTYPDPTKIERTLVIIKPDNWKYASSRPGTIIDMFSRTGLRIIGTKVLRMTLNEALEFYGPVEEALRKKLSPKYGEKAADYLSKKFNIPVSADIQQTLTESFGEAVARDQFYQIVEFMTGRRPDMSSQSEYDKPGLQKCMVLIYEGEDAVAKIREVLGPTNPLEAPGGTIRREFGTDVMVNTAHASDSPENAQREMRVVRFEKNTCSDIILDYLTQL